MDEVTEMHKRTLGEPIPQQGLGDIQSPKQPTLINQLERLREKKHEDIDKIVKLITYLIDYPEFEENLKILQSLR